MKSEIKVIKKLLTKEDKAKLPLVLLLSVMLPIIEGVGLSIIFPFFSVAKDFSNVFENQYLSFFYKLMEIESAQYFVIFLGVLIAIFYIFRTFFNIFYAFIINKFTYSLNRSIAAQIFSKSISLSYVDFTKRNSSDLTQTVMQESLNAASVFGSILMLITEATVLLVIYSVLLFFNTVVTIYLTIIILTILLIIHLIVNKKIQLYGQQRVNSQKSLYEILNSSYANFKYLKCVSKNEDIQDKFNQESLKYQINNQLYKFLSSIPRNVVEGLAFSLLSLGITFFIWTNNEDISSIVAVLTLYAIAMYRLLPSVSRINYAINDILFNRKSLEVMDEAFSLDTEIFSGDNQIEFRQILELKKITFGYKENINTLKNISLNIKKNQKIGIVGTSGAGKSSLLDIIGGIIHPTSGNILVDGQEINSNNIRSWRSLIGYIPQSVYLFDGSISENISMFHTLDIKKVKECLKAVNLLDFVEKNGGINIQVGESGIALSGGQKQRIGIARALYNNAEIFLLDEATSSLDKKNAKQIISEILAISSNKTVIAISHDINILDKFDKIIEIKEGVINE